MSQMWAQATIYARFMILLLVTAPISMILMFSLLAKIIRKAPNGCNQIGANEK